MSRATVFQTEFQRTLPCGFLTEDGTLHREVTMRRATAADEILPLKDPRVVRNPGYLVIILLSRVITNLGSVEQINPNIVERLFATDLAFLQNLYNEINQVDGIQPTVVCPHCHHEFHPPPFGEEAETANGAAMTRADNGESPTRKGTAVGG